jgi:hypothetical protein
MTLVMAYIGEGGAVMAGDFREVTFLGDRPSIGKLEEELNGGALVTDEDLLKRAGELGVELRIRDDKVKVSERAGILTGEVTSVERGLLRRRRVHATGGGYIILDIEGSTTTLRGKGGAGSFVVLGNETTKAVARRCISDGRRNGSLGDAREIIIRSMDLAGRESASVSRKFAILETREKADLEKVMEREGMDGI